MNRLHHLALGAGLAALAAATDAGAKPAATTPSPEPVAPEPVKPEAENPVPPATEPEAEQAKTKPAPNEKTTHMIWVQPGHEAISIGQLFTTPPLAAEALRSAGRARYASAAEAAAAKKAKADIPHFEGV